MNLKGKTVLVVGLARTGISVVKTLCALGAHVLANDLKNRDELNNQLEPILSLNHVELHLGMRPDQLIDRADLIIISPSVPIDSEFVQIARARGIEVMSEIEMAYRLCKAPIVAITGTNGKTTTTALVGEIFRNAGFTTHVVGNIGFPFIDQVLDFKEEDIVVAEVSSFQLEGIKDFHPKVAAILNITEDHLNRHKTMENYIHMKARIFENMTPEDWLVLNADDERTSSLRDAARAKVLLFSSSQPLQMGAWVEKEKVVLNIGEGLEEVCGVDEIFIPGKHNLENALAAVLMAKALGIPGQTIARTLRTFRGIEHRIEFVDTIGGISFYNDSKGTNPDSSIKAIQTMKKPTVLIAGGMDKGSEFDGFIDAFGNIITHMVVLGETAEKLMRTAKEKGFDKVTRVSTMEEAVQKAFSLAVPGGNVLLSPACASWDMFKDYEERGRVFKEAVRALRR